MRKISPPRPQVADGSVVGLLWVAAKRLQIGNQIYNRGCEIDPTTLYALPNFSTLVENGFVKQLPAERVADTKPITVEASAPDNTPRRVVLAAAGLDPVERWRLSVLATAEASQCNPTIARDLLLADHDGSALFRLATRIESERAAVRERHFGRRPAVVI